MIGYLISLENDILLFIQDHMRSDSLTPFFLAVTRLGDAGFVWAMASFLLLLPKKTRKIGCMGICALLLSVLCNNLLLKNLVARSRPYEIIQALTPLIERQADFSFPSGHTAASFAVAGVLWRRMPKPCGIAAVALAFLIGFSRLYLGVHYPSDVLAGMVSGLAISFLAEKIVEEVEKRRNKFKTEKKAGRGNA